MNRCTSIAGDCTRGSRFLATKVESRGINRPTTLSVNLVRGHPAIYVIPLAGICGRDSRYPRRKIRSIASRKGYLRIFAKSLTTYRASRTNFSFRTSFTVYDSRKRRITLTVTLAIIRIVEARKSSLLQFL